MNGLAFLSGALLGLGTTLMLYGIWPLLPTRDEQRPLPATPKHLARRMSIASVVSTIVLLTTRWPVAASLAWSFVAAAPVIFGGRRRAEATILRSEAIASWIENLHDTLSGSAGLHRAIIATADAAPQAIRNEVQELATSLERRDPFAYVLDQFAVRLDDPAADMVAMALVMADDPTRHASDISAVLRSLGRSLREEVSMQRRVHASRASARTGVTAIAVITVAMAAGLSLFSRDFLAPYDGMTGQLMMALIGGVFATAFWYLHKLSKPVRAQRFFINISEGPRQ